MNTLVTCCLANDLYALLSCIAGVLCPLLLQKFTLLLLLNCSDFTCNQLIEQRLVNFTLLCCLLLSFLGSLAGQILCLLSLLF